MTTIYDNSKDKDTKISDHFTVKEFLCHCGACSTCIIDDDLIGRLESLRIFTGAPIRINSGYRCQAHQDALRLQGLETSTGPSTHTLGQAADIECKSLSGSELEALARIAGFTSVGVASMWVHVDLRPGYRRWSYKS